MFALEMFSAVLVLPGLAPALPSKSFSENISLKSFRSLKRLKTPAGSESLVKAAVLNTMSIARSVRVLRKGTFL